MAQACPFCEGSIADDAATECPHCHESLESQHAARYGNPVRVLRDITVRLQRREIPVSGSQISGLFAHINGVLQQTLDAAREDLQKNFRNLTALRSQADRLPPGQQQEITEFIDQFQQIQDQVNGRLQDLGNVLLSARDPMDIDRHRNTLDYIVASVQDAVDRLNLLVAKTSDPRLASIPHQPLPDEMMLTASHLEQAMGAVTHFYQNRDRDSLEKLLHHLDEAREKVARLLNSAATPG